MPSKVMMDKTYDKDGWALAPAWTGSQYSVVFFLQNLWLFCMEPATIILEKGAYKLKNKKINWSYPCQVDSIKKLSC